MTIINESSLSRVWQHFNDPDKNVALLTAFRGNNTYEENVARNRALAAKIRGAGYGFFYVDGFWVENEGTPQEQKVKEDSLFVIAPSKDKNFADKIHELGNEYQQDAVLVKDSTGIKLIYGDGQEIKLGKLNAGALGSMYTKLRNNKKTNTFIFTEERDEVGFIARLAGLKK